MSAAIPSVTKEDKSVAPGAVLPNAREAGATKSEEGLKAAAAAAGGA